MFKFYKTHDDGRREVVRVIYVPMSDRAKRGEFKGIHLAGEGELEPVCGAERTQEDYRCVTTVHYSNWGAELCPMCRLLLDEELTDELKTHGLHRGQRKA